MGDNLFISNLENLVRESCQMDNTLYEVYDVKRGLRNSDVQAFWSD